MLLAMELEQAFDLTRTGIGSLTGYATGFGIERKDAGGSASGTGT